MGCDSCQGKKLNIALIGATGSLIVTPHQLSNFLTPDDMYDILTFVGGKGTYLTEDSIYLPTGEIHLDILELGFEHQSKPLKFIAILELDSSTEPASDRSLKIFLNNEVTLQKLEWVYSEQKEEDEDVPPVTCSL